MSSGEAAQLPTASHACDPPAEAAALPSSSPAATWVERFTFCVEGPDPPSEYAQCKVTLAPCQAPSAESHAVCCGAFRSILLPAMSAGEAAQFPTASQA